MNYDTIVIGAGVAGLQCARRLTSAGASVLVLERAGRVGGRCATRPFDGKPVDYGPVFLHGDDPRFLTAVTSAQDAAGLNGGTGVLPDWPTRVVGRGTPCQPHAFESASRRVAFTEGVNVLPRSLAAGLDVRLRSKVVSLSTGEDTIAVTSGSGERFLCRDLVLATALEQAVPLLEMLPETREREGALALLRMFSSLPALTVVAGYPAEASDETWQVRYPEEGEALLLVSNETTKRPGGQSCIVVYQARPAWSHRHLADTPEDWSRLMLTEAIRTIGPWAGNPAWIHPHRWRYARLDRASELSGPLLLRLGHVRVGVAGDLFAHGGGVQASWLSGDRLGADLAGEDLAG
jgi:predicted NAD/FAD-dependent oxidoreductase